MNSSVTADWNGGESKSIFVDIQNPALFGCHKNFPPQYRIAGMFRRVKVSFLKEKTIFVGFIPVLSFRSISNTGRLIFTLRYE